MAVIFDCDDTILATAKSRWMTLSATAAKFGVTLDEATIHSNWGKPFDQLIGALVPDLDHGEFIGAYRDAMRLDHPEAVAGATDLIQSLRARGTCLIIVTSSSREIIIQDLDALHLASFFEEIYGCEQTLHHKPDPRVLEEPIRGLSARGFRRADLLYVGDSVRDYKVAVGNGIAFYAVLTGLETQADFENEGLDERWICLDHFQLARALGV